MNIVSAIDNFLLRFGFEFAVRIKNLLLMYSGFYIGFAVASILLGFIFLAIIRSLLKVIDECRQNLNEVLDEVQQPMPKGIPAHKKPLPYVVPEGCSVLRCKDMFLSAPKTLLDLLEASIYIVLMWLFPNKHIGEKDIHRAKIIFYSLLFIGVVLTIIGTLLSLHIIERPTGKAISSVALVAGILFHIRRLPR